MNDLLTLLSENARLTAAQLAVMLNKTEAEIMIAIRTATSIHVTFWIKLTRRYILLLGITVFTLIPNCFVVSSITI